MLVMLLLVSWLLGGGGLRTPSTRYSSYHGRSSPQLAHYGSLLMQHKCGLKRRRALNEKRI